MKSVYKRPARNGCSSLPSLTHPLSFFCEASDGFGRRGFRRLSGLEWRRYTVLIMPLRTPLLVQHPILVPALPLLEKALPVSAQDFSNGEVGNFLMELASQPEFAEMDEARLQECFAVGFGYGSWPSVLSREGGCMATEGDLPRSDWRLLGVIAWRMYAAGYVGLLSAFIGVYAAWIGTSMSLRTSLSQLGKSKREELKIWSTRRSVGLEEAWRQWDEITVLDKGRIRIKWAAEIAFDVASSCWTAESGVSFDELQQEVIAGAVMETELLVDRSWFFPHPWPVGLRPTQFMGTDGALVGYGWRWPEVGLAHALVFGSTSDFKASALALWSRSSTNDFAMKELPKNLVEVDFRNPWSRQAGLGVRTERAHPERGAAEDASIWDGYRLFSEGRQDLSVELVATDGHRLALGVNLQVDGEPWTRPSNCVRASDFEGLVGLALPSFTQVEAEGNDVPWLRSKVPFALDMESFETGCRLWAAIDQLNALESAWLDECEPDAEISWILKQSCASATPVVASASQGWFYDEFVRVREMPEAGEAMQATYPEMRSLSNLVRGEYALAFYGKNGLRHGRKHLRRDLRFMAYCVLRNMGLDPDVAPYGSTLGVFRLVRMGGGESADLWSDGVMREQLADEARRLWSAYRQATSFLDELESSSQSRLELVQGSDGTCAQSVGRRLG